MSPGTGSRVVGEALHGQLRAVTVDLARLDTMSGRRLEGDGDRTPIVPPMQDEFRWTALTLRANLSPVGETGRHAVRLAVIVGLAELMVQATGLFEGRWVVLTIFLVLKPDYDSTVNLSAQRAIGTAVGAGLGAAAAWVAHPGPGGLIVAAGFTIAAAYALFDANYLLYSTFLTAYIVIIMGILGLPADTTAMARLTDTAIGAAFALISYSAWPTWEGLTAQEKFARLLEAHGEYATALLHQFAYPGQIDPAQLRALQATARRARTDAEASTARLAEEPPHPPLTPTVARTLVAVVTRLAHSELSLHAFVPLPATATDKDVGGIADADAGCLDAVAAAFSTTMSSLAMGLRTLQPPGPLPPLRRLQTALYDHTALDPPPLVHHRQPGGRRRYVGGCSASTSRFAMNGRFADHLAARPEPGISNLDSPGGWLRSVRRRSVSDLTHRRRIRASPQVSGTHRHLPTAASRRWCPTSRSSKSSSSRPPTPRSKRR
jgi:uncharacterized membrane protein YccC